MDIASSLSARMANQIVALKILCPTDCVTSPSGPFAVVRPAAEILHSDCLSKLANLSSIAYRLSRKTRFSILYRLSPITKPIVYRLSSISKPIVYRLSSISKPIIYRLSFLLPIAEIYHLSPIDTYRRLAIAV